MSCPYAWPDLGLTVDDLRTWRYFLIDMIKRALPCEDVELLPALNPSDHREDLPDEWLAGLAMVRKNGRPVVDADEHRLFLPLHGDQLYGVAILEGGSPELYEKYTVKALLECSRKVTAGLKILKDKGVDSLTGLFNDVLFHETGQRLLGGDAPFFLIILEAYPRIRDAEHAQAYLKRVAGSLDSMAGRTVPVFHLGSGTFAMFWEGLEIAEAQETGDVLLYRLQREGFARAHMGMVQGGREERPDWVTFMERGWDAVVKARQRGPFARASYVSRADREKHPFKPIAPQTLNSLKNLWRKTPGFSLALVKADQDNCAAELADRIREAAGSEIPVLGLPWGGLYLFFAGRTAQEAGVILQEYRHKIEKPGTLTFSAGIAEFPCENFKRTAIPLNSRKALQHTFFYGSGTTTVFNAVSLNISGDVYYNEGDLNSAVHEYLLGLEMDGGNVNLLNSLGVTYVRLNRVKTAIGCFEKVLEIEKDNFMALFNLGSAWLSMGRDDLAVEFLERGLKINNRIYDLVLQLGGLYCRTGQYERVVDLLAGEEGEEPGGRGGWEKGEAWQFLGEAWHNLGENAKAIGCLQQAYNQNPLNSKVLSLLGRIYDLEGEGDDIALALCREGVELDDKSWDNWLRLGQVEWRQRLKQEAISSLQKSLRLNNRNLEAARMLEEIYRQSGKKRLAERLTDKISKLEKAAA